MTETTDCLWRTHGPGRLWAQGQRLPRPRRSRRPSPRGVVGRAARAQVGAVLALTAMALGLFRGPALAGPPERLPVLRVGAIGVTVSDVDRAAAFYQDVLQFEKSGDVEVAGEAYERLQGVFGLRLRTVRMRLGEEEIELTEYLAPRGRAFPEDTRSNDRWFQHIAIVVSDMDRAYRRLREHRVEHASSGPQRLPDWNPNAGGIEAFYFRDPDGHFLEVIRFPRGKGDPRWQRPAGRLFLGIDHTAIVVADTERSLDFYRDRLGLEVRGASENHGTEQEHLNNVFGARLRITTLRASGGPGIELLEYLAPRDGRPYPAGARPNDLLHWQTRIVVRDVEAARERALSERGAEPVSAAVLATPRAELDFRAGALVRDPDGHALLFCDQQGQTETAPSSPEKGTTP